MRTRTVALENSLLDLVVHETSFGRMEEVEGRVSLLETREYFQCFLAGHNMFEAVDRIRTIVVYLQCYDLGNMNPQTLTKQFSQVESKLISKVQQQLKQNGVGGQEGDLEIRQFLSLEASNWITVPV